MPNVTEWEALKSVFNEAIDLPADRRGDFLRSRCDGDESLLLQVRALLDSHEQASDFLELAADTNSIEAETSIASDRLANGEAIERNAVGLPSRIMRQFAERVGQLASQTAEEEFEWPRQLASHYEFQSVLGKGGMGIVALARDTRLDRLVAVKLLSTSNIGSDSQDENARMRLEREAKSVAQIRSDHVITLHHVDALADGNYALVMEFVDGPSLSQLLSERGSLAFRQAAEIVRQAALGVEAAHQAGIVHRDIKPGNILLRQRREGGGEFSYDVKVSDFGLARFDAASNQLTQDGMLVGTPAYMSPEQVRDPQQTEAKCDVYGLGVTLYRAMTGEVPFRGTPHMVLSQIVNRDPIPPRQLNDKISRDLESICLKAMAKDASDRYASAGSLAADLNRALNHEPILARPVTPAVRLWRYCRRNPRVAGLAALAIGLLLVMTVGSIAAATLVRGKNDLLASRNQELTTSNERLMLARHEADQSRALAQSNAEQAEKIVKSFLSDVSQSKELLAGQPGTQALRAKLLEQARAYYVQMAEMDQPDGDGPPDDSVTMRLANANLTLGMIDADVGRTKAAKTHLQQAAAGFDRLRESNEYGLAALSGFAEATGRLADLSRASESDQDALARFAEARYLFSELVERDSTERNRMALVRIMASEGDLRKNLGETEKAQTLYNEAIVVLSELHDPSPNARFMTAALQAANAGVLRDMGNSDRFVESLQTAMKLAESLADENPLDTHYSRALAEYCNNLSSHYAAVGESQLARESHTKALAIYESLIVREPSVMSHRRGYVETLRAEATLAESVLDQISGLEKAVEASRDLYRMEPDDAENIVLLSDTLSFLANRQKSVGEIDLGDSIRSEAFGLLEKAVKIAPTIENLLQLARLHSAVGHRAAMGGDANSARRHFGERVDLCRRATEVNPQLAEPQDMLSYALSDMGVLLFQDGQIEEASAIFNESVAIARHLAFRVPNVPAYRFRVAFGLMRVAGIAEHGEEMDDAFEVLDESVSIMRDLVTEYPSNERYHRVLMVNLINLGDMNLGQDRMDEAIASYREAESMLRPMVERFPDELVHHESLVRLLNNRGVAELNSRDFKTSLATFREHRQLVEKLLEKWPDRREYQLDVGYSDENMANWYRANGEIEQALVRFTSAEEIVRAYLQLSPNDPEVNARLEAIVEGKAAVSGLPPNEAPVTK